MMQDYVTITGPNTAIILIIALWSLFWKGLALWHSARKGNQVWFLLLLVVNVFGILEIFYLFGILRLKPKELFKKH